VTGTYETARARLRGLVLNQPTPYRAGDLAVDHAGLRDNIERWLAHRVPVIMLTAGTSDFASLSEEEIRALTRTTVEAVAGRAFVIACTGPWWLGRTIQFARFCADLGADALMVVKTEPPAMSPEDAERFHRAIADAASIPLVYHSYLVGPKSIETLRRVLEVPAVIAMKQETNDFMQYALLRDSFGDRLGVMAGAGGELAYYAHQCGAVGSLTGTGQWAPGPERRFVEQMLTGDFAGAREHLDRILPYRRSWAATNNNTVAIKFAMDLAGFCGGPPRPMAGIALTAKQQDELAEIVRATGLISRT